MDSLKQYLQDNHTRLPNEIISQLDEYLFIKNATADDIEFVLEKFEKATSKFEYLNELDEWIERSELNVLVETALGNLQYAENTLQEILKTVPSTESLSMKKMANWLEQRINQRRLLEKRKRSRRIVTAVIIVSVVVISGISAIFNSDDMVIATADPTIVSLATSAGMSKKAEAIFIRTKPEFVDAETIKQICADAGIQSDAAELGCYVPSTNRIYIRDLPEELNSGEIVTAAHEMLHAAAKEDGIDEIIADLDAQNVLMANNTDYQNEMKPYASLDHDSLSFEREAIFGTEFSNLSPALENFYQTYFDDGRVSVTAANSNLISAVTTKKNNLNVERTNIDNIYARANTYYNYSVAAARSGNAYNNSYYYSKYTEQYNEYTAAIDKYNADAASFNSLISDFLGESLSTLTAQSVQ
jgi:hypothetical protein